ncbi:zinc ribbon domain-containing protein [Yersinia alsatica]|uniref:zinc ribbon domain-containing protein n=1 Tax=Yersinia alsatica TaxID=2890317 RepID=UPI0011A2C1B3|nr:zinc ribbon domain-containing protein [Yersinia alsatica]
MSQQEQFCQACGMPMSAADAQGASDKYCAYCSDAEGHLKSWEEAVSGLAELLDSWQKVGPEEARKRAKRYLTAMPAWAHKADD